MLLKVWEVVCASAQPKERRRNQMRRRYVLWLATGCVGTAAGLLAVAVAASPSFVPEKIVVNGSWTADANSGRNGGAEEEDVRMWSVDLQRDGSSITGEIVLPGTKELQTGKVEGQIIGQWVSGTIIDADGNEAASFSGSFELNGVEGTYEMANGETGVWSWAPPSAPQAEAIEESDAAPGT
jgi:hypothetical protein